MKKSIDWLLEKLPEQMLKSQLVRATPKIYTQVLTLAGDGEGDSHQFGTHCVDSLKQARPDMHRRILLLSSSFHTPFSYVNVRSWLCYLDKHWRIAARLSAGRVPIRKHAKRFPCLTVIRLISVKSGSGSQRKSSELPFTHG